MQSKLNARRSLMITMVVIVMTALSGCSLGIDSTSTDASSSTKPSSQATKLPLREVAPAAIQPQGVVRSGQTSGQYGNINKTHYTFSCQPGLKAIKLGYLNEVQYGALALKFDEDTVGTGKDEFQSHVSVLFTGDVTDFAQKVVSMILTTDPGHSDFPVNDKVVNLLPSIIMGARGLTLNALNITNSTGAVHKIKFCVRP